MTPNGEIYYRKMLYRADFSNELPPTKHVFIHEMTHVLQYQRGMWVRSKGWVVGPQVINIGLISCVWLIIQWSNRHR